MKKYEIGDKYINITLDNDKIVKVNRDDLEHMADTLEISMDEAVMTYLEDEEYEINEEQEALTKKAKENRITATIHQAEDKRKERKKTVRTVKENPTKELLVAEMVKSIAALNGVTNLKIENKAKLITFDLNGESFKVDLIQKRKPKA